MFSECSVSLYFVPPLEPHLQQMGVYLGYFLLKNVAPCEKLTLEGGSPATKPEEMWDHFLWFTMDEDNIGQIIASGSCWFPGALGNQQEPDVMICTDTHWTGCNKW